MEKRGRRGKRRERGRRAVLSSSKKSRLRLRIRRQPRCLKRPRLIKSALKLHRLAPPSKLVIKQKLLK